MQDKRRDRDKDKGRRIGGEGKVLHLVLVEVGVLHASQDGVDDKKDNVSNQVSFT